MEEILNKEIEKQFQQDLRTAQAGIGEAGLPQHADGRGAQGGGGGGGHGAGFKMFNELLPGSKLHEGLGPVEFSNWKSEAIAWSTACNMSQAHNSVQFQKGHGTGFPDENECDGGVQLHIAHGPS